MTSWLVRDRDGRKVGMFDCNGSSKARMEAFRLLVAKGKAGGKLLKDAPGKPEDVCWIDVREGTYRIIDPEKDTVWLPLVRKLAFLSDDEWAIMDAELVSEDAVASYCVIQGIDPDAYDVAHPMMLHCRSIPDPGEAPLYEFSDERLPRSFPIWGVRRLVSCS